MQDPAILRQRAKVELVPDKALERLMPPRKAVLELALLDGRSLSERVGNVRGTAENPMSRQELIATATELVTPVLGAAKCRKLVDTIFGLERIADIRTLRPLLQPA